MINLLPPMLKEERLYGKRNVRFFGYSISLLITASAAMAIMLVGLQFIGAEEPNIRQDIDSSAVEISVLEKSITPIEEIASRLETAKTIRESSVDFSKLLPEIGAVLPQGVILNALTLTGGSTDPLQLDVDLKSADLGPILIRNLVDSDLFEAADISALTPKGTSEDDKSAEYTFSASITASFTGASEAKRKEQAKAAAAAAAQTQQSGTGAQ